MNRATPNAAATRLDRMLQDPLIQLVMASDKVNAAEIRRLADRITSRAAPSSAFSPATTLLRPHPCAGCA